MINKPVINTPRTMQWLLILTVFFTLSCRDKPDDLDQLERTVLTMLGEAPGKYALAFRDLSDTSRQILYREKELFHAASTMKTPVLAEVYRQSKLGKFRLDDSLEVHIAFRSIVDGSMFEMDIGSDSGEKFYDRIGDRVPIYDLAYEMITSSNNLATNLLIERVGSENVTATMRNIGAPDIVVLRGVEDLKAYEAGLSNRTTAYDLMVLFQAIGQYTLIDSTASQNMINILLDQQFNEIIPALLPDEVKVAHKTGSITKVMHDSGLVILPNDRKYVLVLLSSEWENEKDTRKLLAEISHRIYSFMERSVPDLN
jgi:beta-lactamase class A